MVAIVYDVTPNWEITLRTGLPNPNLGYLFLPSATRVAPLFDLTDEFAIAIPSSGSAKSAAVEQHESNRRSTDLQRNVQDQQTSRKGAECGEDEAGVRRSCGSLEVTECVGSDKASDAADGVDKAHGSSNHRGAEDFRRDGPEGRQIDRSSRCHDKEGEQHWQFLGPRCQEQESCGSDEKRHTG